MAHDFLDGILKAIHLIITLNPEVIEITLRSLRVSLLALIMASLLGIPLGILLSTKSFKGKKLTLVLIHSLMGLPPVLAGLILYLLLTTNGLLGFLDLLFSEEAMMMVQFVLALPIIMGLTHNAIEQVPDEITELALTLGADRLKLWRTILNEARLGILLGIITALGRLLAEVGGILIVGGNIRFKTRTLTTSIVQEVQKGDFSLAIALGIILLTISLLVNGGLTWYQFNHSDDRVTKKSESRNISIQALLHPERKKEIQSFLEEYQHLGIDDLIQEYLRLREELEAAVKDKNEPHISTIMFEDLHKEFNEKPVFSEVHSNKTLTRGQLHGIIGPNGIGKSTLLKIISGILDADKGTISAITEDGKTMRISFEDSDQISGQKKHRAAQADKENSDSKKLFLSRVVYVHQHPVILKGSCWNNVTYVHGENSELSRRLGVLLLTLVGLENKIFHNARSLSGGQKQLLCFARALASFPDVLLVDEPTSNLDFQHMLKLEHVLYQLAKSNKMLIIFTTHDLLQVQRIADEVGILKVNQLRWYDPDLIHDIDDPWIITMKSRISEIIIQ